MAGQRWHIRQLCACLCLVAALLPGIARASAAEFSFAALGDAPYTESEEAPFLNVIAAINRARPAFTIHVGDFKSGWSPCTDDVYEKRREWFGLFHQPLIYTPGDNEWTDCRRAPGAARDPLERLQRLRQMFFADNHALGQQKLLLARQHANFPEHAQWRHEGVLFATLNVPGGDNNARMPHESAARGRMLEAWIGHAFDTARTQRLGAVVLAMQANPWSIAGNVKKQYGALITTLTRETLRYDGDVLLIHGDTHRHRIDKPLVDPRTQQPVANFTRIEVFGSPVVNWVRITVRRENGRARFEAAPGN